MPRYSCKTILRDKLKYAIHFCKSIDTDDYARIALTGEGLDGGGGGEAGGGAGGGAGGDHSADSSDCSEASEPSDGEILSSD